MINFSWPGIIADKFSLVGRQDVSAGLLLAAIAIPEQLATARLAGMPAEAGLYTFIAGTIGFAVFGSNRFLSAGADSTIAPIIASGLAAAALGGGPDFAAHMTLLSVMVGLLLVTAAVLQAGWIADLLSVPVLTGFLAGVAVHIGIGQLPVVLGLPDPGGPLPQRLISLWQSIAAINSWSTGIGLAVLASMLVLGRWRPRWPGALIVLVSVSLLAVLGHLEAHGVEMVGALPAGLPVPRLPLIEDAAQLFPLALIVAMVCLMQTASVLRAFPSQPDGPFHVTRDFGGMGAGNVLSGLFGGFPVNASPPRTALVVEAGGQSQAAALLAAGAAALLLLGGGWLLAYLPRAALAGVLIAVACRIFRLNEMLRIARLGGFEILMVLAAAVMVVVLPIQTGMIWGVVFSLLHGFYVIARPHCAELRRAPGTTVWWPSGGEKSEAVPGILVFAPSAPLNFTNASYIRARLRQAIREAPWPIRLVIIEASGMIDIDYTGAGVLCRLIDILRAEGTDVALARLSAGRAHSQAMRDGLYEKLGPDRVFHTVEDAVRALQPLS